MSKEEAKDLINEELGDIFTPVRLEEWWTTPSYPLDGKTAREYLDIDPERLYNIVVSFGR